VSPVSKSLLICSSQEKLSQSEYTLPEQFENDFNLMIKNVTTYFPPDSLQHQKAVEIKSRFDMKWKVVFGGAVRL
jgi:hypothetical protein